MQKQIKFLTVLNLAMYLISCGPLPNSMQGQNIDARLAKYLDQFQSEGEARGLSIDASHLTMSFSESMPSTDIQGASVLAYCQRSNKGPSVVVKGSSFDSMSVSDREQVLFHELGHCLLGLEHNDATESAYDYSGGPVYATGVPSSIMNKLHFGASYYNGNRREYLNRLFKARIMPLYWNAPSQFNAAIYN